MLLQLDLTIRDETQELSLLGVRRAQLQLACEYLAAGDQPRAQRIAKDLSSEPQARLARIASELQQEDRAMFWELTERGIHFAHLEPELRPQLTPLLTMINELRG